MTDYLTIDSLNEILKEVGLSTNDVREMRFDAARAGNGERCLILVVTTFARDEKGNRYFGQNFGASGQEAATETRRFFVKSLGSLEPCPVAKEQVSTQ